LVDQSCTAVSQLAGDSRHPLALLQLRTFSHHYEFMLHLERVVLDVMSNYEPVQYMEVTFCFKKLMIACLLFVL